MLTLETDASGKLFDKIMDDNLLKNDAALARYLEIPPPVVSKIRHGRMPVGSTLIINVHELTGWSIREIKALIAA